MMDRIQSLLFWQFIGTLLTTAASSPLSRRVENSCTSVKLPPIPGINVLSVEGEIKSNVTLPAYPPLLPTGIPNLSVCEVRVIITHQGVGDKVQVLNWLPLSNWNGRFTAVGGSGWAAGLGNLSVAPLAAQNFAAATTDAGLSGDPFTPAAWALTKDGHVNLDLLTNFATRSIHEVAVVGKAVTTAYFGRPAAHSYWNGCSTGGRQGLVAAQRYPNDFDGILAGAPAIYWPEYVVAEQWPLVVMKEANVFPSNCELDAITKAAIAACDELDGVQDNVISDLGNCRFDPFSVAGSKVQCDGQEITITASVAAVVQKIWEGPKRKSGQSLWYGLNKGAPLDSLANTTVVNGTRTGVPFFVNDAWIRYFVKEDPNFNLANIGPDKLAQISAESTQKYDGVIESANPDLFSFKKSGGKLVVWQGDADQLIFPQGTIQYRQRVESVLGGGAKVDEFFRLFIAPGVDHCGLGSTAGAVPSDPFSSLVSWVENGTAPEFLAASRSGLPGPQFTRKICSYPLVSKYRGSGDPSVELNYDCIKSC